MLESAEEVDAGENEKETMFGAGPPSYEDLVEENSYLRSERSQLYDELARASVIKPPNVKDCTICNLKHQVLANEISKEKDLNKKLHIDIDQMKQELAQLNIHGLERSEVSKELEQRLEQSEENLIATTAELLQILPLRIKLNEMRQKCEVITGDILISNNKISEITRERDKMKLISEICQKSLKDAENSLEKMSNKVSSLKSEKESKILNFVCDLIKLIIHFYSLN
jgi:chromosome segregation ATPase